MCDLCVPQEFSPCDICCARRDVKTQMYFDNGTFNQERYECMMTNHNVNIHEQVHSSLIDVCVDKEMLNVVEHINRLGVPTAFSCIDQNGLGTPGVVIKGLSAVEISEIIRSKDHAFDNTIMYYEWLNLGINRRDNHVKSVTLYFPQGLPF